MKIFVLILHFDFSGDIYDDVAGVFDSVENLEKAKEKLLTYGPLHLREKNFSPTKHHFTVEEYQLNEPAQRFFPPV